MEIQPKYSLYLNFANFPMFITLVPDIRFHFSRRLSESTDQCHSSREVKNTQIHFWNTSITTQIQFVFECYLFSNDHNFGSRHPISLSVGIPTKTRYFCPYFRDILEHRYYYYYSLKILLAPLKIFRERKFTMQLRFMATNLYFL